MAPAVFGSIDLILLPNSPQAGSDMLNNMIASFVASNQIGEKMKEENQLKGITSDSKTKKEKPKKQNPPFDDDEYRSEE